MAVKPWLGAIRAPSDFKPLRQPESAPKVRLELEYAFGYRVKDCRNNLKYLNSNIAYHCAGVGVIMDPVNNVQHFFREHTDDITSFAIHEESNLVATGEIGAKPALYLWDAKTQKKVQRVPGKFTKGINNLEFSKSGTFLAITTIDQDHIIYIYDVKENIMKSTIKSGKELILDICFNDKETELLVVGVKLQTIHSFLETKAKPQKLAQSDSKTSYACQFAKNKYVITYNNGYLQTQGTLSNSHDQKFHDGAIDALTIY